MILIMALALRAQEKVLDQFTQMLSQKARKRVKLMTLNDEIRESQTASVGSTLSPKTPSLC